MLKALQYRLYPTRQQCAALVAQLHGHRLLYNAALAQRKETYETTKKGVSYSNQAVALLPTLRQAHDTVARCNYSSLQQTLRRLDKAFTAFFRRVKAGEKPGYPRFKAVDRFNTINYATLGDGCQIKDDRLYLQNIGRIKVKWHRPLQGTVRTVSVTCRNQKWHVCMIAECEPDALPPTGKSIGVDVGLSAFLTTSNGEKVDAPQYFRTSAHLLKHAQQRVSRRKKGSHRRRNACRVAARCHERIANQRRDFCHKTALLLVQSNDLIVVEKLRIANMVKNHSLAKSIHDAAWGLFLSILRRKAENAGRRYEEVNPNGTSQLCSACGKLVPKSLAVRLHCCPACGVILDRDHNAALNILARTGPSALAAQSAVPPRSCLL